MGNIEDKQQGGIFDPNHINSYIKYKWSKQKEGTESCGKELRHFLEALKNRT